MGEVVLLNCETRLPIPPDRVLEGAVGQIPEVCLVLGWDSNNELYAASSINDRAQLLWLIERARIHLLEL